MKQFFTLIITHLCTCIISAQPALEWQKVYGGTYADYNSRSVTPTTDGGYILAGAYSNNFDVSSSNSASSDGLLMKFDAAGTMVWRKTYGETDYDIFNSVQPTSDGGYIACGTSFGYYPGGSASPTNRVWLVKLNAAGDTIWQKTYKYINGFGNSARQTSDGGYILASTVEFGAEYTSSDLQVTKVDGSGNVVWETKMNGDIYYSTDGGYDVQQTSDGYIAVGYTETYYDMANGLSSPDYWIVKLDLSGNMQWKKIYGGNGSDYAYSVTVTTDGGYFVTGISGSANGDVTGNHGGNDYWLLKLDANGAIQWKRCYGGSQNDNFSTGLQTSDGGYIVTGYGNSNDGDVTGHHGNAGTADAWVLKIDASGDIQWQSSVGGILFDGGTCIRQTSGGYIMTGNYYSRKLTNADYWIVKLDNTGSVVWQNFSGASGGRNFGRSIVQTADNGYTVAGTVNSTDRDITGNRGGTDGWLFKTDNPGTIQWQKTLGGSGDEYFNSIKKTTDGGYIIAATSTSNDGDISGNHGNSDYWIVKTDATGNIQWQKSYGGSNYDSATSIQTTIDGGYIVGGRTSSNDGNVTGNHGLYDYWVIKLDASGNLVWQKTLGGTGNDYNYSIAQTIDGGFIAAGESLSSDGDVTGNHGAGDFWVVKLDAAGNKVWQKAYGGTSRDYAYSVLATPDGGSIVAGSSYSTDGDVSNHHGFSSFSDFWLIKLDAAGAKVWENSFGSNGDNEYAFAIKSTADGGYVVSGASGSVYDPNNGDVTGNHGNADCWVTKVSGTGNLLWQKSLGGTSFETAYSIQQTNDGGYITAGYTSSHDGDVVDPIGGYQNFWLVKLAADVLPITFLSFDGIIKSNTGLLCWRTANEINNKGYEVQKSSDGHTFSDIAFIKGSGNSTTTNTYSFTDIKLTSGSNYYRLKQIDLDGKYSYSPVVKLDYSKFEWSILGNPVKTNTWVQLQLDKSANVSLTIIDVNGHIVETLNKGIIQKGIYSIPINLNKQSPGSYIIKLMVDDLAFSKKILKQ